MSNPAEDLMAGMNRVEGELRALGELSARDLAAFTLEHRKAAVLESEHAVRLRDEQSYDERYRRARHHDVLCIVLKELIGDAIAINVDWEARERDAVARAHRIADLAYPPPEAKP